LQDVAVSLVAKALGAERCLLLEVEGDSRFALLSAAVGWPPGHKGKVRFDAAEGSMLHRALHDEQPVWTGDVLSEQRFRVDPRLLELGRVSCLCMPIQRHGRVRRILCVVGVDGAGSAAEDSQFLLGIARTMGDAIGRLQADEQLRRSEARLHTLIDHELDGALVLDRDGNILFLNSAARKLLGRDSEETLGRQFGFPMISGETTEVTLLQPGNKQVDVEMRLANIEWEGAPCSVVSLHDISERKALEDERRESLQQIQHTLVDTIQAMARALEKRDPYTAGHQSRVADLAAAITVEMGLAADRAEGVRLGGMIHDIGKIYVPAEILNRPGKLTPAEFEIIKAHPQVGYDIIRDVEFPWPVAEMVYQHHERLDGSGYPRGLQGEEIVLEARILAVADVVEAMASHRPYREGLGIDKALEEIRLHRGSWFEPDVVDACLRLFEEKDYSIQTPGPVSGG